MRVLKSHDYSGQGQNHSLHRLKVPHQSLLISTASQVYDSNVVSPKNTPVASRRIITEWSTFIIH